VNSGGEEVTPESKSFRIRAPATGKARRPTVESLTAGTNRLSVTEDRSLCRVSDNECPSPQHWMGLSKLSDRIRSSCQMWQLTLQPLAGVRQAHETRRPGLLFCCKLLRQCRIAYRYFDREFRFPGRI